MSRNADRPLETRTVLSGAAAGLFAYLFGYLVTYVWQSGAVEERLRGFNLLAQVVGGDPIPTWKAIAWLFYNAHFVTTRLPALGGSRSVNFVAESDAAGLTLLYAVPPLLLLVAGALTALFTAVSTPRNSALAGAATMPGYLVPAVVVANLSSYAVGDAAVAPTLVTATLLAGVVYPLVFGTLGGVLAGLVGSA